MTMCYGVLGWLYGALRCYGGQYGSSLFRFVCMVVNALVLWFTMSLCIAMVMCLLCSLCCYGGQSSGLLYRLVCMAVKVQCLCWLLVTWLWCY